MKKSLLAAFVSIGLTLFGISVLSGLSVRASDALTEAVLGGIEGKAKGLLDRAKSDANDVVNNAAQRAIDVIEACMP